MDKQLIVYFSASGTTRDVEERVETICRGWKGYKGNAFK